MTDVPRETVHSFARPCQTCGAPATGAILHQPVLGPSREARDTMRVLGFFCQGCDPWDKIAVRR